MAQCLNWIWNADLLTSIQTLRKNSSAIGQNCFIGKNVITEKKGRGYFIDSLDLFTGGVLFYYFLKLLLLLLLLFYLFFILFFYLIFYLFIFYFLLFYFYFKKIIIGGGGGAVRSHDGNINLDTKKGKILFYRQPVHMTETP